jgi:hypothetical protein
MIIDYTYHVQQKVPDIRYGSSYHGHTAVRAGIADAKSDACSRLRQLSDRALRRVTIYVAGGLVARCVLIAVNSVGFEQHTWWCWFLPTCLAGLAGVLPALAGPGARRHSDSKESS